MNETEEKNVSNMNNEKDQAPDLEFILKVAALMAFFVLYPLQISYTIRFLLEYYNFFISTYMLYLLFFLVESIILFFLLMLYHHSQETHGKITPPTYNGETDVVGTSTFNGIGTRILGWFRYHNGTYAGYIFFCVLVPLIPLSCIRYSQGSIGPTRRSGASRVSVSNYTIYGTEKWKLSEIVMIYLGGICFAVVFLLIIEVIEMIAS